MPATSNQPKFHVGDRVSVDLGRRRVTGFIVEDRGPIGVRGRRLFQVEIPLEPDEPMKLEMPEEEIQAATTEPVTTLPKEKVVGYLINGGLISILRANNSGGRNQPRAWLCLDTLGNITHTFNPDRGVIGGQVIPFFAVHDDRVFTPKQDEVVAFLRSFGLDQLEVAKVVSKVRTAP